MKRKKLIKIYYSNYNSERLMIQCQLNQNEKIHGHYKEWDHNGELQFHVIFKNGNISKIKYPINISENEETFIRAHIRYQSQERIYI